jgi:CDP-L-myo-inositol myo-inositolphosphotransferase
MATEYNGYISKHINRKASDPMANLLTRTRLTPNQVSWAAFGIAFLSFVSFVLGLNIIAGVLVQLSSIVDGVDGSLARLKGMSSKFGGFLDSMLDRYADILILLGLTFWSLSQETYPGIWLAGFLAATGTIFISYTRARISSDQRYLFDKGFKSLASRDVRLFLIMLGAISAQASSSLIVIAVLTIFIVLYRFIYRQRGSIKTPQPHLYIFHIECEDSVYLSSLGFLNKSSASSDSATLARATI